MSSFYPSKWRTISLSAVNHGSKTLQVWFGGLDWRTVRPGTAEQEWTNGSAAAAVGGLARRTTQVGEARIAAAEAEPENEKKLIPFFFFELHHSPEG